MNYSIFSNMYSLLTKSLKVTLVICLLFCISGCSKSDDYEIFAEIYGTVTDYQTGVPLENVSLTLSPSGAHKQTDVNGNFSFEGLDAQKYVITAQKSGYQANRTEVLAQSGQSHQVDIHLIVVPK